MPDYNSVEYWDHRYGQLFPEAFDWLFTYRDIRGILQQYIKPEYKLLIVGCGNAPFSADLYDDGYQRQHNIDTSKVVIAKMKEENKQGMEYHVMDVTALEFEKDHFDAVVDKSLVDTIMCCEGSEGLLGKMYSEISRVLKPGGVLFTLSLHCSADVLRYVQNPFYNWVAVGSELPNPRFEPDVDPQRSKNHSMVICKKLGNNGRLGASMEDWTDLSQAINPRIRMEVYYEEKKSFGDCTTDELMAILGRCVDCCYQINVNDLHRRGILIKEDDILSEAQVPVASDLLQHELCAAAEEQSLSANSQTTLGDNDTKDKSVLSPSPKSFNEPEGNTSPWNVKAEKVEEMSPPECFGGEAVPDIDQVDGMLPAGQSLLRSNHTESAILKVQSPQTNSAMKLGSSAPDARMIVEISQELSLHTTGLGERKLDGVKALPPNTRQREHQTCRKETEKPMPGSLAVRRLNAVR